MILQEHPSCARKICGIVFPYQSSRPLLDENRAKIAELVDAAVEKGRQGSCSIFLFSLCDEYNAYVGQCLKKHRQSLPKLRVNALVPMWESVLPTLPSRIATEDAESFADAVQRIEQPIEDFPLNAALYCDVVLICSYEDMKATDTLIDDIAYIRPECRAIVIKR